jgi:hypothetical protein
VPVPHRFHLRAGRHGGHSHHRQAAAICGRRRSVGAINAGKVIGTAKSGAYPAGMAMPGTAPAKVAPQQSGQIGTAAPAEYATISATGVPGCRLSASIIVAKVWSGSLQETGARCHSGAAPGCGAKATDCIAIRRLTASGVAGTIRTGAWSAISRSAVTWDAPAMTGPGCHHTEPQGEGDNHLQERHRIAQATPERAPHRRARGAKGDFSGLLLDGAMRSA